MDANLPKTPGDILKSALIREKSAHDFYEQSAMHCKIPMVRALLESLMNEETHHMKLIQAMITKLELG